VRRSFVIGELISNHSTGFALAGTRSLLVGRCRNVFVLSTFKHRVLPALSEFSRSAFVISFNFESVFPNVAEARLGHIFGAARDDKQIRSANSPSFVRLAACSSRLLFMQMDALFKKRRLFALAVHRFDLAPSLLRPCFFLASSSRSSASIVAFTRTSAVTSGSMLSLSQLAIASNHLASNHSAALTARPNSGNGHLISSETVSLQFRRLFTDAFHLPRHSIVGS
jgi:hypothetical protein